MTTTVIRDDTSIAASENGYLQEYAWSNGGRGIIISSQPLPLARNKTRKTKLPQTSKPRSEVSDDFHSSTSAQKLHFLLDTLGAPQDPDRDDTLALVRGFENIQDGWDGPDSICPKPYVIEDALTVLQYWPVALPLPEPEPTTGGTISLELFDEDGLTIGGIELLGDHLGVYSVINDEQTVAVDRFSVIETGQLLAALDSMQRALSL